MASAVTKIQATGFRGAKTLKANIDLIDPRVKRIITGIFLYHEPIAQTYMKEHAPWTDRTGNARAGLHTRVTTEEDYWELIVAHTMWYGFFLETRFSGKFAILQPTVNYVGKLILQRINSALQKLEQLDGEA